MAGFECKFCKRVLSSKASLLAHQKKTKYCLKIQNGQVAEPPVECATCEFCDRSFDRKSNFTRHVLNCSKRKLTEVDKLRVEIANLEKVIVAKDIEIARLIAEKEMSDKLAEKDRLIAYGSGQVETFREIGPKTTTNNYINPKLVDIPTSNIRPLTIELVQESACNYTYEQSLKGVPGLVEYVVALSTLAVDDCEVERNYVCTDISRNKFHRLLNLNDWSNDGGGNFLRTILDGIYDVSNNHYASLVQNEKMTDDIFERDRLSAIRMNIVNPVNIGITCKGDAREKLFADLRSGVRDVISI